MKQKTSWRSDHIKALSIGPSQIEDCLDPDTLWASWWTYCDQSLYQATLQS